MLGSSGITLPLSLYPVYNTQQGAATNVGSLLTPNPYGIVVSPDNNHVYPTLYNNGGVGYIVTMPKNTTTNIIYGASAAIACGSGGATDIAISPDGRSVFGADIGDSTLYSYNRNPSTGALTQVGTKGANGNGRGVIVSANGNFVYIVSAAGNYVYCYSIDKVNTAGYNTVAFTATPTVTPSTALGISAGVQHFEVAFDGGGYTIYSVTATGSDTMTSMATLMTTVLGSAGSVAAVGTAFVISSAYAGSTSAVAVITSSTTPDLFASINTALTASNTKVATAGHGSGALTALSTPGILTTGNYSIQLVESPAGTELFIANYSSSNMTSMSKNVSSGILSLGNVLSTNTNPRGIAVSPSGTQNIYVACQGSGTLRQYAYSGTNMTYGGQEYSAPGAIWPVVSSDGLFVYCLGDGAPGNIYQFSRDPTTGNLTALTPAYITSGPVGGALAMAPDGKSMYSTDIASGMVLEFARNTTTGLLSNVQSPYPKQAGMGYPGAGPNNYTMHIPQSGTNLYFTSSIGGIWQYSRDTTTGALTISQVYTISGSLAQIISSPDSAFVYVSNTGSGTILQFTRNLTTGALTAFGTPASGGHVDDGIAMSPDGTSVYTDSWWPAISLYSRNTGTGQLTFVSNITPPSAPSSSKTIVVSPDGLFVYVTGSSGIVQYTRNTSTGALTSPVSTTQSGAGDLFQSPDGLSMYCVVSMSSLHQYARNPTTGALTALSPTTAQIGGATSIIQGGISPDGLNLYWTDQGTYSTLMGTATRDTVTGKITAYVQCQFVGSYTASVLTVTSVAVGHIYPYMWIASGIATTDQYTGAPGGVGTYGLNTTATAGSQTFTTPYVGAGPTSVNSIYNFAMSPDGKNTYALDGYGNIFSYQRR